MCRELVRESYHGGEHTLQDSAQNVEDIAQEPNYDELHRECVCAALLEIFDDLRGENDDLGQISQM
jgi:hypothetical protein